MTLQDFLKKYSKRIALGVLVFVLVSLFVFTASNVAVTQLAKGKVYTSIADLPQRHVGLLLGTGKYAPGGLNRYFVYRIDAAEALLNSGKIDYLVISGDNSTVAHNEPRDMANALVERGIAREKLFLDYAGFDTYDSVVRMDKIFGQHEFTIISQGFHAERGVVIARSKGLEAIGFAAQEVTGPTAEKTNLREKFSRVKVFYDMLTNPKPKFLGEMVPIP